MTPLRPIGRYQGLAALVAIVGLGSVPVALAATGNPPIATLEAAQGGVTVIRLGQPQPSSPSMPLQLDDIVVTKQGRATVRFETDGAVLRIGPDSRVQINESAKERDITLFFGRLWAHVVRWKERPTRFTSGSTIAAIRGTELSLALAAGGGDETQVAVLEGTVQTETDAGKLMVTGGQVAVGRKGSAPVRSLQVKPQDAVRWALYYLPVIQLGPAGLGEGTGWAAQVQEATAARQKGDLQGAIESLEKVAVVDVRDPRFFTYRASLLLEVGSVDEAGRDIEQALKLAANDSDALSLETIIAVVNNEDDKALAAAQKAVAANPKSATAQIALSYARQAKFDLEGARQSLESAVQLQPGDALAWARLAEIRSSLGYLGEAVEAARKATSLEPSLARTQSVLGFAYLTQVRTGEAKEAFRKAIALDEGDPLPRLGLGLAEIRDGGLKQGSQEIEIAVSLDPGSSLVRSYLGKAYYEAKRDALDEREYGVAKGADPRDPTPWFYDAIAKQTTNRPVEALDDNQQAIALNDDRGVYRSRLMLDSDLAARSASLGRLYADLGFQELALVEGWNSVNTDPGNFSAHRLLADSYAVLPRHEIARVSELFQSQMLQPLNTTSIQPSLGESNLFLISAQGPSALAFNEFNPLFNRDQANLQGSFTAGQDNTWSGEAIASGIYKKLSFSAGFSSFKTDGFTGSIPGSSVLRTNNDQDDKIANAFVQAELSPSTSVQGEVRYRKRQNGDLSLTFAGDDFQPLQRETNDSTSERIGLRHEFNPNATLLVSYMHSDKTIDFALPIPDAGIDYTVARKENANSVEGQFLFRTSSVKAVAGGGYFDIGGDDTTTLGITDPESPFAQITVSNTKTKHTNLYAYANLSLPADVTLTLGVSGDLFDQSGTATFNTVFPDVPPDQPAPTAAQVVGSKDLLNPKLGIIWSAKSGTTLRAAWFRTLKRTLVTDQTLEPTQVAGFNQFFDDATATQAWVYGAALDQKFGKKVFGGFEFSGRDLTIPYFQIQPDAPPSLAETDGKEKFFRAYLFAAPQAMLTLSAEYQYEDFERNADLALTYQKVKTQRVPFSARFFHPSGFSAFVGVTYLHQDGEFLTFDELGNNVYVPGKKDFWIVDAGLRYRLPRRYGFLVAGVNNLTDEKSTYQATDSNNLTIRPGRVVYGRVVVAFP